VRWRRPVGADRQPTHGAPSAGQVRIAQLTDARAVRLVDTRSILASEFGT
jgi:hypothetical protein